MRTLHEFTNHKWAENLRRCFSSALSCSCPSCQRQMLTANTTTPSPRSTQRETNSLTVCSLLSSSLNPSFSKIVLQNAVFLPRRGTQPLHFRGFSEQRRPCWSILTGRRDTHVWLDDWDFCPPIGRGGRSGRNWWGAVRRRICFEIRDYGSGLKASLRNVA